MSEEFPHCGEWLEILQSEPERLGAGFAVALASQEAAQRRHHAHRFPQVWRLLGWPRILVDVGGQRFPFGFLEVGGARNIRDFPAQLGQMKNAPRHHQINCQAGFNALGRAELPLLDAAATFQRAMINFNPPAQGVPTQLFASGCKTVHRAGGRPPPPVAFLLLVLLVLILFFFSPHHLLS